MYFRQVVWQVVIKIVIEKKQSGGKKTSSKNNSCFCCNTFKRASYSCIHLLGYRYSFFHSKVQGLQDTVSLLLICPSPHTNAFVNSRAADVLRSLSPGVSMPVFSHVYMYFHFKPAASWTSHYLCAFSWLGSIACIIKKACSKVTVKWSLSFFWFDVHKSEVVFLQ